MKCPYCEKEMTLGYIQCRDGVYWTLKKQLVASLSSLGKGSTCLSNGAADNSNTVFAFKCEDCKKIIIDYSSERYNRRFYPGFGFHLHQEDIPDAVFVPMCHPGSKGAWLSSHENAG